MIVNRAGKFRRGFRPHLKWPADSTQRAKIRVFILHLQRQQLLQWDHS